MTIMELNYGIELIMEQNWTKKTIELNQTIGTFNNVRWLNQSNKIK